MKIQCLISTLTRLQVQILICANIDLFWLKFAAIFNMTISKKLENFAMEEKT